MTCNGDTARKLMAEAVDVMGGADMWGDEADAGWYDDGWEDDDYNWRDDPNRCPECGGDLIVQGDYVFCADIECGYSEYLGDEADESDGDITDLGF